MNTVGSVALLIIWLVVILIIGTVIVSFMMYVTEKINKSYFPEIRTFLRVHSRGRVEDSYLFPFFSFMIRKEPKIVVYHFKKQNIDLYQIQYKLFRCQWKPFIGCSKLGDFLAIKEQNLECVINEINYMHRRVLENVKTRKKRVKNLESIFKL